MNYRDLDEMNKRKREKELPENFDYEAYNHFSLDKQEVKIIQESLTLLDDIIQNASNTQDLKGSNIICIQLLIILFCRGNLYRNSGKFKTSKRKNKDGF